MKVLVAIFFHVRLDCRLIGKANALPYYGTRMLITHNLEQVDHLLLIIWIYKIILTCLHSVHYIMGCDDNSDFCLLIFTL